MPNPETGGTPGAREGDGGLSITVARAGRDIVLRLRGELDLRTVPQLRGRLTEAVDGGDGAVVVDLDGVAFIDSSGLSALLTGLRRLTRVGRRMLVACGEGPVLRMLRLTRLDCTFTVHASTEAALRSLGDSPPAHAVA